MQPDPHPPATMAKLDVMIRAGLILALALLCYRVFAPFMELMVWALILAVTLYPLHQAVAGRIGGRQGLAATSIAVLAVALIVVPSAVLMISLGSVYRLIQDVQHNTLRIPSPHPGVAWVSGGYGSVEAAVYSVLLGVSGMADNILKPLMLGRGVDAPMPVILLGALVGMVTAGILGMFVGATGLALGYQIFKGWVAANPRG